MAVVTSLFVFPALARSQELKMHSDWINKFLVTVHNSKYLMRPDPSTLALRVKRRQRQTSRQVSTKGGRKGLTFKVIRFMIFGFSILSCVSQESLH